LTSASPVRKSLRTFASLLSLPGYDVLPSWLATLVSDAFALPKARRYFGALRSFAKATASSERLNRHFCLAERSVGSSQMSPVKIHAKVVPAMLSQFVS